MWYSFVLCFLSNVNDSRCMKLGKFYVALKLHTSQTRREKGVTYGNYTDLISCRNTVSACYVEGLHIFL
jgi:hypothetical protein